MENVVEFETKEVQYSTEDFNEQLFQDFMETSNDMVNDELKSQYYKGMAVGAGIAGAVGAVGWGLWAKELRENKLQFEALQKTIVIATGIINNKDTAKYKKEEIDLTKMVMESPTDLIIDLKSRIENQKFVSKKKKERQIAQLEELISISGIYKMRLYKKRIQEQQKQQEQAEKTANVEDTIELVDEE